MDILKILQWLKRKFNKRDLIIITLLIVLFFTIRLVNLDKWPIFSDEGIYIRWAKTAWKDASWRFISVTDGRQPLQTWATIPLLKLLSPDDLLAGRLFAVFAGFTGFVGMFTLLFYLWGKRAAYLGSLLYIFLPYFVFYERIALVDAAVNAGFIWIFFFSVLLARTRRFDIALLMGFVGGGALLAKSSSRMFLGLSAFAPLLFFEGKAKKFLVKSLNYFVLLTIAVGISLVFYNVQRLSPYFHYVEQKNTTFIMTLTEFLATPLAYFPYNAVNIPLYVAWESGWLITLLSIAGFYLLVKKEKHLAAYLAVFILAPYISISFFAKVLFPRYVLFYGSILIITATYFLLAMEKKTLRNALLGFLITTMLIFNYPLLFDPARASFPQIDRGQYIEGVTAVWGAEDLMSKLRKDATEGKPVLILAEGDFGLVADVLRVYDQSDDDIEIKGLWPLNETHLYEYQSELSSRDVYIVFSHREEFPSEWPMELVEEYEKPVGDKALYLFKLTQE